MTKKQASYQRLVKIAAFCAVLFAVVQISIKLYAWFITGASAMLASSTDSLLDLAASFINLIMLTIALRPADNNHKFGHGKAESLTGLFQSAFILASAILLIIHGIEHTSNPVIIQQSHVGIWVTIVAFALTLLLVVIQKWVLKQTNSLAIEADSLHYQSDLLLNAGVLCSLILSDYLWPRADGIFTIIVGAFLIVGAFRILKQSVDQLMDHELTDAELKVVQDVVKKHKLAIGVHDIRSRQAGEKRFIQCHLELDDDLPLYQAHEIGEEIRLAVEAQLAPCEVFIHHDPVSVVVRH
ncbi:cation diffusion facilitator family transporter [Thalassotalea hakodatensis]|uniref:cation diffusion facilitator family transporter n=1 Tax=Thalassotalea hakodatensis TaxID=3030492 RepID=UPI002573F9E3|nr:cation diffusion facilitator family transporter [Thalassotalea hakodatensis]